MSSIETMQSWPIIINNFKDMPLYFSDSFKGVFGNPDIIPYTILFPVQNYFFELRKTGNVKMITYHNDRLYIFENQNNIIKVYFFLPDDILYIEKGKILLNSWIKICGVFNERFIAVKIEFNSVCENLVDFFINKIRLSLYHSKKIDTNKEKSKFDFLEKHNYKLRNYSKDIVIEGMEIKKIIFQTFIKIKKFKFISRRLTEFSMVLSDNELIIIKDGHSKFISKIKYGAMFYFVPLKKITGISIKKIEINTNIEMKIDFDEYVIIKSLFDIKNEKPIYELINSMPDSIKKEYN